MRFLKKCIDHATIKYVMKTPIVPLTHHSWSFKWQGKLQRGYAVFAMSNGILNLISIADDWFANTILSLLLHCCRVETNQGNEDLFGDLF